MSELKIFICGFMGAGKSTFSGHLQLAESYDLDEVIFAKYAAGYAHLGEYIAAIGWPRFRHLEGLELELFCTRDLATSVLALGGGALNQRTLALIRGRPEHLLVWLDTPFNICWQRITGDKVRPLAVKSKKELAVLYAARCEFYSQAHLKLGIDQQNGISQLADLLAYLPPGKIL